MTNLRGLRRGLQIPTRTVVTIKDLLVRESVTLGPCLLEISVMFSPSDKLHTPTCDEKHKLANVEPAGHALTVLPVGVGATQSAVQRGQDIVQKGSNYCSVTHTFLTEHVPFCPLTTDLLSCAHHGL